MPQPSLLSKTGHETVFERMTGSFLHILGKNFCNNHTRKYNGIFVNELADTLTSNRSEQIDCGRICSQFNNAITLKNITSLWNKPQGKNKRGFTEPKIWNNNWNRRDWITLLHKF